MSFSVTSLKKMWENQLSQGGCNFLWKLVSHWSFKQFLQSWPNIRTGGGVEEPGVVALIFIESILPNTLINKIAPGFYDLYTRQITQTLAVIQSAWSEWGIIISNSGTWNWRCAIKILLCSLFFFSTFILEPSTCLISAGTGSVYQLNPTLVLTGQMPQTSVSLLLQVLQHGR